MVVVVKRYKGLKRLRLRITPKPASSKKTAGETLAKGALNIGQELWGIRSCAHMGAAVITISSTLRMS